MHFNRLALCASLFLNASVLWAGDADGDGVNDVYDVCVQTPHGAEVDSYGCAKDSDLDGVIDLFDRCEETPFDEVVDAEGCPLPHKENEE